MHSNFFSAFCRTVFRIDYSWLMLCCKTFTRQKLTRHFVNFISQVATIVLFAFEFEAVILPTFAATLLVAIARAHPTPFAQEGLGLRIMYATG